MSVFSSMRYCLGDPSSKGNLWAALVFMPFGLFFDFMDGKVARWRNKSSLMGQELDSLADLVGVLQYILQYVLRGLSSPLGILKVLSGNVADGTHIGFIRYLSCSSRICYWSPHTCRSYTPHILCSLRPHPFSPLQYHRGQCSKRRNRKEQVF